MNKRIMSYAGMGLMAMLAMAGCRREDFREMTVEFEKLSEADKPKIVESLAKYGGIDHNTYRWDMAKKSLTMRYDSMKIAQANIRYAIDEKGIKVVFPKKTDNHAGH